MMGGGAVAAFGKGRLRIGRAWGRARWDQRVAALALPLVGMDLLHRVLRGFGWDTRIYCAAGAAFRNGLDPYHVENLGGQTFSYTYQPLYLYLIAPLCAAPAPLPYAYPLASLLAVVASVLMWPGAVRRDEALPAAALAAGGMCGLVWVIATGNTSAFELLALTLAVTALRRGMWGAGALILGVLGSLKLFSLALLAVVLVADAPWRRRLAWLAMGGGAFLAVAALSAVLQPELMVSFLEQITGRIAGQHTPIGETGNISNPALIFALAALAGLPGNNGDGTAGYSLGALALSGLALVVLGAAAALVVRYRERGQGVDIDARIGFVMLIAILFMPRLKPYSFMLTVLPIWLLARPLAVPGRAAVLAMAVVVPTLSMVTVGFGRGHASVWWHFQQTLTLVMVLGVLFLAYGPLAERLRLRVRPPLASCSAEAG